MVYEQQIPPIPNRIDELKMMEILQKSWLSQPFYRYYMNENLRIRKMQFADRIKKTRRELLGNLFIYGLLFIPVVMLTKRYYVFSSRGIPHYNYDPYYILNRSSLWYRQITFTKKAFFMWAALTFTASIASTSYQFRTDDNYNTLIKTPVML